jgi:hypothetical protein
MARHQKVVSVVWELLSEPEAGQENRVIVDVDIPVRPFGEVPLTPPRGVLALDGAVVRDEEPAAQRGHRLPRAR